MKWRADMGGGMRGLAVAVVVAWFPSSAIAQQSAPNLYPEDAGDKPRGSSEDGAATRHDQVGRIVVDPAIAGMAIAHPALAVDMVVELTALDTGRNVLAIVRNGSVPGQRIAALAPAVAQALGIEDGAAVRIRRVQVTAADRTALRDGRPASARLDSPPALLAGLRTTLANQEAAAPASAPTATPAPVAVVKPARPVARPPTKPRAEAAAGQYFVRVAALSARDNAERVARELGGEVVAAGKLHLVRIGPLPDRAAAAKAREKAAARGFKDALIVAAP